MTSAPVLQRVSMLLVAVVVLSTLEIAAGAGPAGATTSGEFVNNCLPSHRLNDDPIVAPGAPGASHSHDFYGNRSTNAFSTDDTLRAASTTCESLEDRASYWLPTLLHGGVPVAARTTRVYYRSGGVDPQSIKPFPPGLRVIAGDAKAVSPQPLNVASWACSVDGVEINVTDVPTCPDGKPLRLRIVFPNCWNGVDLDSADHKSHMAYSRSGRCPATHPIAVPNLTISTRFWITGGPSVTLASGSAYTGHADFFNAWNQPTLERLIDNCIKRGVRCNPGDGTTLNTSRTSASLETAEPEPTPTTDDTTNGPTGTTTGDAGGEVREPVNPSDDKSKAGKRSKKGKTKNGKVGKRSKKDMAKKAAHGKVKKRRHDTPAGGKKQARTRARKRAARSLQQLTARPVVHSTTRSLYCALGGDRPRTTI